MLKIQQITANLIVMLLYDGQNCNRSLVVIELLPLGFDVGCGKTKVAIMILISPAEWRLVYKNLGALYILLFIIIVYHTTIWP